MKTVRMVLFAFALAAAVCFIALTMNTGVDAADCCEDTWMGVPVAPATIKYRFCGHDHSKGSWWDRPAQMIEFKNESAKAVTFRVKTAYYHDILGKDWMLWATTCNVGPNGTCKVRVYPMLEPPQLVGYTER